MDKNFKNNLSYNQSILKNTQIDKIDVNGTRIAQFLGMPLMIDEVHSKPSLFLVAPALTISNTTLKNSTLLDQSNQVRMSNIFHKSKSYSNFDMGQFKEVKWKPSKKRFNHFNHRLIYQPQIQDGFGININF